MEALWLVVMLLGGGGGCRGLGGGAAAHVVAVVAAAVVVADEPGVGLGLELADAGEAAAVERGAPALLQDGAVEAFAHGVVVRATGAGSGDGRGRLAASWRRNPPATHSGPLSVSTARTGDAEAAEARGRPWSMKRIVWRGVDGAEDDHARSPSGWRCRWR